MEYNFWNLWLYHATLLFSYIVFASPIQIFNGIQLLWLICVILPLMSSPIMVTPGEKGLMSTIPCKFFLKLF